MKPNDRGCVGKVSNANVDFKSTARQEATHRIRTRAARPEPTTPYIVLDGKVNSHACLGNLGQVRMLSNPIVDPRKS